MLSVSVLPKAILPDGGEGVRSFDRVWFVEAKVCLRNEQHWMY